MTVRSALSSIPLSSPLAMRRAAPEPRAGDDPLMTRLSAGDPSALAELSEKYRARIQRFVRCYAAFPPEICADIAQQVLVEVMRTADRFEGRSRLTTWLFGIARNVCRTQLRRREDAVEPDARVWRTLPDPGRDPHELFEHGEATLAVRHALDALPAPYRAVLVLREWEELSYDEVAAVLGVPVGTVRSRLHSARALLAEHVLAHFGGDHDRL